MTSQLPDASIKRLVEEAALHFSTHSDSARLDAELLICHVLNCQRTFLFTWPEKTLDQEQLERFNDMVAKRLAGHPIAHIVGYREFWDLKLAVNPSTLIPRPDTEILVEQVLADIDINGPKNGKGLDLGTGTGAIALALASCLSNWHWLGVDVIPEAVQLAKANGLSNQVSNADFIQSHWFAAVGSQKFDFIVSNPPYIDDEDQHLSQGDVRFEPKSALVAQNNGLADITQIVETSRQHLLPNGRLILEHGHEQGLLVRNILSDYGFQNVKTFTDLAGNDRVSIGYF